MRIPSISPGTPHECDRASPKLRKQRPLPRSGKERRGLSPEEEVRAGARQGASPGRDVPPDHEGSGMASSLSWASAYEEAESPGLAPRVSTAYGHLDRGYNEKGREIFLWPSASVRILAQTAVFLHAPAPGGPSRARQCALSPHTYGRGAQPLGLPASPPALAAGRFVARLREPLPASAASTWRRRARRAAVAAQVTRGPGLLRSPDPCGVSRGRPVDPEKTASRSRPATPDLGPRATCAPER